MTSCLHMLCSSKAACGHWRNSRHARAVSKLQQQPGLEACLGGASHGLHVFQGQSLHSSRQQGLWHDHCGALRMQQLSISMPQMIGSWAGPMVRLCTRGRHG